MFDDTNHIEDCVDYFAIVLMHKFPSLQLEKLQATDWRQGWMIFISPQSEFSVADIEDTVIPLRDKIFWKKDVLIPYVIVPPDALEDKDGNV